MRVFEFRRSTAAMEAYINGEKEQQERLRKAVPGPVANWVRVSLEPSKLDSWERGPKRASDLMLSTAGVQFPLLTPRVERVLREHFGIDEQWLEVDLPGYEYRMLNLLHVVDALDQERSDLRYFKSSGRLQEVKVHVFRPETLKQEWLFRDATRSRMVLCTDRFERLIAEEGWTGFDLKPIWDSEHDPFPSWPSREQVRAQRDVFGPEGFVDGYQESWPPEWTSTID